jgi:WD40 repeat protein
MALSPNGKTIASGSGARSINGTVRLWDIKRKKVIARCTGHTNVVYALYWSADGGRLVSGSWDGTARVWDVDSGKTVLTIKTGHQWVRAVAYSPDSSKLVTGGDRENFVKIWDAQTGELLNILKHDSPVCSFVWTSDGKKLISGSFGLIEVFDTATWQQIAILQGHTHSRAVNSISLSSNNRLLASASFDKTARLWNLDTNLPVGPPLQHERDLRSASLSRDSKVLVTACENKNAYAWDVRAILKEAGLEDLLVPIGTNIVSVNILAAPAR